MAKPSGFSGGFGPGFGVGRYRYELTPYVWDTSTGPSRWRLPAGSVGGVDLRTIAQMSAAGGAPQGTAFVAALQPTGGVAVAAALHMADEAATVAMRDAWEAGTGFRPDGATLADLLADQLTAGSDPAGESGPKPLLPGVDGVLRVFLGGHSEVWRQPFRFGPHPHTSKVRELLRRDFERVWESTNGHDVCRKVLDDHCLKYRVDDWREFVPTRLHAHVPGRLPRETSLVDDFTRADGDTIGNQLSWTEYNNNFSGSASTAGDAWDTASNAAKVAQDDPAFVQLARAESDLSSDDHYAQITLTDVSHANDQLGPVTRFENGSGNDSMYIHRVLQTNDTIAVTKLVGGTISDVGTPVAQTPANGGVVRGSADGSTIKTYYGGVEKCSETDTSVTGHLRCGIYGYRFGGTPVVDSFEAADLGAGTFTGTAALTHAGASFSGTAAFVPPTYTGTLAATHPGASFSGAAAFTTPVYTGVLAATHLGASFAGVASFGTAVFTGTLSVTHAGAAFAGVAAFAAPSYTGVLAVTHAGGTFSGTATFTTPVYAGTAALTHSGAVFAGTATFAVEVEYPDPGYLTVETPSDPDYAGLAGNWVLALEP